MSLEKVDIQEVFHEVADGKLEIVKTVPLKIDWLESRVRHLEDYDGVVSVFPTKDLFVIEQQLLHPQNKSLKERWDRAIKLSTKIRMRLLKCKALDMLEEFDADSKAPQISFCKAILEDVLNRAKYLNRMANAPEDEDEEADELVEQLEGGND